MYMSECRIVLRVRVTHREPMCHEIEDRTQLLDTFICDDVILYTRVTIPLMLVVDYSDTRGCKMGQGSQAPLLDTKFKVLH